MENENIGVEVVEVAEQPIATEVSVETQEVAEPVSGAETQEITTPVKDDRDSWFAEKRRELEAKEKEMETKFQSQLEAERNRIAELETKTQTYEKKEKYDALRTQAEQYGLDYDELVAEVEKQEALETEKAKTLEELQLEKTEKQQLADDKKKLESDLQMLKMSMEDRDELLAYDPTINLNELTEDFYKFRVVNGFSPTKAYKLAQSLKEEVVVAETVGKVNSAQADPEYYSAEEYESWSDEQRKSIMKNPATYEKLYKSQMKWLSKK